MRYVGKRFEDVEGVSHAEIMIVEGVIHAEIMIIAQAARCHMQNSHMQTQLQLSWRLCVRVSV